MASGIVSGLILFLLAAFAIEWWIGFREKQKTRQVKEVAYKVLAHVMRQEGQYVHALTTGDAPLRSPLVPVDPALLDRCIAATLRVRTGEGGQDLIQRLCADADWREAAHLVVRDLRLTSTAAISQWAAMMMQTSELTEDFNSVARAIDGLSPVQRTLNDARAERYGEAGGARGPNWPEDLEEALLKAQLLSIQTQEALHREIGDEAEFKSPQRRWLSDDEISRLESDAI